MGHIENKKRELFLNSKELKEFIELLKSQYGEIPKDFKEHAFARRKDRICIVPRDVDLLNLERIRISSVGLYIAEVKGEQVRLSIEGAQIIGKVATRNVCDVSKDEAKSWLLGNDIKTDSIYNGFVIVKHQNDILGSGRYQDGTLINFVPKTRRLQEIH